ncbi:MAG: MBL fold metallo-hydrolase, partial [Verrucomicrobiales bacterium]|nr:MBL fold metallo-hydrolase [Verrucomicrobiales bacterium]
KEPEKAIEAATGRIKKIYQHYLESNALHWYFGEERMGTAATRTLGENHEMKPLLEPLAEHVDLPDWCKHIGTTKLLISKSGNGFVLDVGGQKQFDELKKAIEDGLVKKIDGIWVTHVHNDHTRLVADAAREFDCPVYGVEEVMDVMKFPGRWFLPGVTNNPVDKDRAKTLADGEKMKWEEFQFTAHFYPGQMYNHGALLVEKPDHKPVLFVGDSFSPSGMDDYCMMNRNLMRPDTGYALCFEKIRSLPKGTWLVNQHIPHLFRFTPAELSSIETSYGQRRELIEQITPWDDPNFAIDEEWAWFYPYGQEAKPGDEVEVTMRIWNHSEKPRKFEVLLRESVTGLALPKEAKEVELAARENGEVTFTISIPPDAAEKIHVITADIRSQPDILVEHWVDALIRVKNE